MHFFFGMKCESAILKSIVIEHEKKMLNQNAILKGVFIF